MQLHKDVHFMEMPYEVRSARDNAFNHNRRLSTISPIVLKRVWVSQDISSISIKQFLMVLDSRGDLHHFSRF